MIEYGTEINGRLFRDDGPAEFAFPAQNVPLPFTLLPAQNLMSFAFVQKISGGMEASTLRVLPQLSASFAYRGVTREFLDYVVALYRKASTVVFRIPDLMRFENAKLERSRLSNKIFFFPRYPVRPFGWVYGSVQNWSASLIKINGNPSILNYRVYPDIGVVEFFIDVPGTDVLTISYDWILEGKIIPDMQIEYPVEIYATPDLFFSILGATKETFEYYDVAPSGGMVSMHAVGSLTASGTLEAFAGAAFSGTGSLVASGTSGGGGSSI